MKDLRATKWWKDLSLDAFFQGERAKPFIELCVLASMIAAGADGTADAHEYDHVITMVDLATGGKADRDTLDDLVGHALRVLENDGTGKLIEELQSKARGIPALREAALAFAIACAASDEDVSEEESEVLGAVAKALDLEGSLAKITLAVAAG